MSRLVDQLRIILGRHFEIREETAGESVLAAWGRMGLDLSAERGMSMHVLLPDEDAATELAFRAEAIPGFARATLAAAAAGRELAVELALTFHMTPEAEAINRLERLVLAMGGDLGAAGDGWSLEAEESLPQVIAA